MENQRNFGALLGGSTPVNGMPTKERVELLPVDLIDPHPLNPRIVTPEGLDEAFLESVERNGVLQPVFVKLGEGGRYQMLAGHRRLCASKVAKHTHIRAIVKRKLLPGEESVFLMDTNMLNSAFITIIGTAISLVMTALMAYPLSRRNLRFRNQIMFILVLTMVFHPGMIPNFLNVKSLGLYNNTWSLILPGMIGTYNLVLVRNFYQSLPESMMESARIDGASDWKIFTGIVVPLSKPIYATVGLYIISGILKLLQ